MLLLLWIVESIEPEIKVFVVKATGPGIVELRPRIEALLRGHKLRFEMRASSTDELAYEVRLPTDMRTDRISRSIAALREETPPAIEWEEK